MRKMEKRKRKRGKTERKKTHVVRAIGLINDLETTTPIKIKYNTLLWCYHKNSVSKLEMNKSHYTLLEREQKIKSRLDYKKIDLTLRHVVGCVWAVCVFVCCVWVCACVWVCVYVCINKILWLVLLRFVFTFILGLISIVICTWWSKPSPLNTFAMNWSNPLATICRLAMPTTHSTFLGVTIFSKFAKWNTTLVDNNSVIYRKWKTQKEKEIERNRRQREWNKNNVSNGYAETNLSCQRLYRIKNCN